MLKVREHGPVAEVRLTTTILRRPIYSVSAFLFDGMLIDSGPQNTGAELSAWAGRQSIEQIVNTHDHEDHVGGNAHLPQIPAYAPAGCLDTIRRAPCIPLYRRLTFGQPRPASVEKLPHPLRTRHHTLQVIATPGHAPAHVALLLAEEGWLFSGDLYLMGRARYVRRQDDVGTWLASLRRVLAYDFDVLFCSHAGRVPQAKTAIRRKIAFWEGIREKALALEEQGVPRSTIRDRLLGKEGFITYWSQGRFAKANLIEQLLAMA